MRAIRAALNIVNPPHGPPGRDGLKAAIAARDRAQQAAEDARATVERLRAVILTSDDAARTAADAVEKVKETRSAWVKAGCPHSGTNDIQILEVAAAEATRAAESAARDAKLVPTELARAESILKSAQFDVSVREQEIAAEVGAIIAAEELPLLRRYETVANELRTLRLQIKSLERVLDPDRYEDAILKSDEGAHLVKAALGRGVIQPWDAERDAAQAHDFVEESQGRDQAVLEQLMSTWRDRAAVLHRDPDAE